MMLDPVTLEAAWRWIEDRAPRLEAEEVTVAAACGRVPVGAPAARADVPATARVIEDGYAVRAGETLGAAPYNPLSFRLAGAGDGPLPPGSAASLAAGQAMPAGADALLPDELVEPEGEDRIGVLAAVAEGDGVVMAASELRAGASLWRAEGRPRPLRPAEIGLLSAAGITRLPVIRRPRIGILVADAADGLGPMLQALVERDGGVVIEVAGLDCGRAVARGADVVLAVGRADGGPGLEIRGVAIEPGRETCLGHRDGALVARLPALPPACFWAYELVAGRAVRSLGGRDPGLPYVTRRRRTTRKIASALGFTEVVPVRLDPEDGAAVLPVPAGRAPRLRAAAQADGFTLVAAASEGCPAGSLVTVWLFEPAAARDAGRG